MTHDFAFPPYGHLMLRDKNENPFPNGAPPDWHGPPDWANWMTQMINLLSTTLWPTYDIENGTWTGAAAAQMRPLTETDLTVIKVLRPLFDTKAAVAAGNDHYALFIYEDNDPITVDFDWGRTTVARGPDKTLRLYLETHAKAADIVRFANGYLPAAGRKMGTVHKELKWALQRPRPYQIALMLGDRGFRHTLAKSSLTPSMVSGHSYEAPMAGVAAFYNSRTLDRGPGFETALQRHTVDVGDRRVLAGIHYPSDNVASWITALLVTPNVSPDLEGAKWLWQAITQQSMVYKAAEAHLAADATSAYAAPMRLLNHIGTHPGITVEDALTFATTNS
jgi:PAP2 superfamily